ncbi:MAG: hypothetical protein R6U46_04480 [Marinilabilia sp.]
MNDFVDPGGQPLVVSPRQAEVGTVQISRHYLHTRWQPIRAQPVKQCVYTLFRGCIILGPGQDNDCIPLLRKHFSKVDTQKSCGPCQQEAGVFRLPFFDYFMVCRSDISSILM